MEALKAILQTVVRFIRNQWISLASGVVALLAVGAAVYGMTRTTVVDAMQQRVTAAREIDGLLSNPQNDATIAAEKRRAQAFDEVYNATLAKAADHNRREPLMPGVFPPPPGQQTEVAYRFRELYQDRLYELPRQLQAGVPPTQQEIQEEEERMEEEARRRALAEEGGGGAPPEEDRTPDRPGLSRRMRDPKSTRREADLSEAEFRAAVRKARSIRLFAEMTPARSVFHVSPIIAAKQAPTPLEMWHAQVSLWVQEDVVDAIRELNDEAAQALARQDREEEIHVGNLPVKRIIGIDVFGYINSEGQLIPFEKLGATAAGAAATGVGEMPPSFVGRTATPQFDVVRFGLTVVVDKRDLLKLVDRITRKNFNQLVGISYVAGPEDGRDDTYFYGRAPVVVATLHFEGYMARKVYKGMMPKAVLQELGIQEEGG
jgi:hypothetical protein